MISGRALAVLVSAAFVGGFGSAVALTHTPERDIDQVLVQPGDSQTKVAPEPSLTTPTDADIMEPASTPPINRGEPGAGFVESFDGDTGLDRFDTGIYHRGDDANGVSAWPGAATWSGDHDLSCGSPDTQRTIHRANRSESFYMCRDHMMTSIGDTDGYSTGYFAPRQTFSNVTQVSWDANVTDLLGRQWWEVSIVPASFNSGIPTCPHCSASTDLSPVSGLPVYPAGSVVVNLSFTAFADGVNYDAAMHTPRCSLDAEGCASKAIRRPFSVTDNNNGTVTIDWGGVRTRTIPGSFPDEFRVVFKDHNYTPDKDGIPAGHTWHWDNIAVR